jgi:flagellar biosynthesis/type III secretory pathway M-ring protein FliF/YscJ
MARDFPAPAAPSDFDEGSAHAFDSSGGLDRPSIEAVPFESLSQVPDEPSYAPVPFAAAQQASGSSKWVWVVVVLLLLVAAGALVATRQGVKLF